jgi:hypothetical protein
MTRVLTAAERARIVAERERLAWNLPRPVAPAPHVAPVAVPMADAARARQRLDWQSYLALYFPDRRRHDFEALAAYGAYRSSGDPGDEDVATPAS